MNSKKNKSRLINKIYRRIHWLVYAKIDITKQAKNFYPSYHHRKRKAKSDDTSMLYITQIPNEGAGIGHQMSNFISGVHASELFGVKYVYPGFCDKSWEEFLGFYQNSVNMKELKEQGYKVRFLSEFKYNDEEDLEITRQVIKSYGGRKIIFTISLDTFYANQYEVIPYIKSRFESAPARKNDKLIFNPSEVNIAVHIRRGDILKGQQTGEVGLTKRWLDMDYYESVVRQLTDLFKADEEQAVNKKEDNLIKDINSKKGCHIYIFSEGDVESYRVFEKYGKVTYCFDMSAMDSFLHMVRADYLVLSKSSFSYNPALLSDGIRICPPNFWHGYPADSKWIVADEDGKIKEN